MILKQVGWRGSLCLVVALVLLFWTSSAAQPAGSPWPMAHGNAARNGRASVNGPAVGQLFWSLPEVGEVFSSPVIGPDGTIYVISDLLYAVSPEGTILWSFNPGGPCGTNCQWQLGGAPAVGSDGTVYLPLGVRIGQGGNGPPHGVVALSPSGIEQWRWVSEGLVMVPDLRGAYYNSYPRDLLIGPDGTIYGLFSSERCFEPDPRFGLCPIQNIEWSGSVAAVSEDGNGVWVRGLKRGTPTQMALGSSSLYFGRNYGGGLFPMPPPEHFLIAVDPSTGDTVWELDLSSVGWIWDPAVGDDGTIYVSLRGPLRDTLYAFNPDGTEKWSLDLEGPGQKPAIGPDGTLYVAYWTSEGENFLSAVEDAGSAASILWTIPLAWISSFPVVDAAGVIYLGLATEDERGKVVAFSPDGTVKWEVDLEGPPYSPPALQEGFLYVGGSLYAIKSLPPAITLQKTAVDLNGLPLKQGHVIEYTIVVTNNGGPHQDNLGHEFEDPIPANTLYIEGSASASSGVISFEPSTRQIVWNGSMASGESVTLKFQVRVMRHNGVGLLSQALFWVMTAAIGLVGLRNRRAFLIGILLMVSLFAFNACTIAPLHVCNQGTFHMDTDDDGIPDTNILTDDPSTPTAGDSTCL